MTEFLGWTGHADYTNQFAFLTSDCVLGRSSEKGLSLPEYLYLRRLPLFTALTRVTAPQACGVILFHYAF